MGNGYTEAFNKLEARSTSCMKTYPKQLYRRVAIYLGRVMMAQTVDEEMNDFLDSPITGRMEWAGELFDQKEPMLDLFVQINSREWKMVKSAMFEYAGKTNGSEVWLRRRIGFIRELDTLWNFHH